MTMRSYGFPLVTGRGMWAGFGASVLLGAMWAVLAAALGMLVRNTTVALVAVLLWKFVIENVVPLVANAPDVRRWMPSSAAEAVLFGGDGSAHLSPLAGVSLFAGYLVVITAVASFLFIRRDPV
jgi:hypothetical protein